MDDPLNDLQHAVAEPYLLYRSAISLATQIDRFFERRFKSDGIELAVRVMEVAAELGTVLLSPPTERNSSGTASLRRAFGRISSAIETAQQLERQKMLSSARCKGLSELLFEIRDGIIVLIGDRGNAKLGELDKQNRLGNSFPMKATIAIGLGIVGFVTSGFALSSEQTNGKLKIGDAIPAVAARDQDGKQVNLAEAGKTGYTLIYFYPKAMTPGCTAQACSLRDSYSDLQQKGVKIFGISLDTVADQKKFQEINHLPFELLSDSEKAVTSAFGVPLIKNAFATRQAYLFKDGKLVWLDTKASTDKQAQDLLTVLKSQQEKSAS